jgi:TRAP-type C4-dicarboxylate transport system permease small subunit
MRTLLRLSDAAFLGVAAAFSAGFFACVLVQVFYRYVLEEPLPWTEELARYLFVWAAMLAAAVSVGRNDQFNIPLFADALPPRWRLRLEVAVVALGLGFALVLAWKGWAMADRMMIAVSPVLPVSQGAVYLVIPIAGAYMAVHLAWRLAGLLRGRVAAKDGPPW